MKKLLLGALMIFLGTGLYAQNRNIPLRDVPNSVQATFSQKFTNAKEVEWKEEFSNYSASFEIGDVDHKAAFTSIGKLIAHTYDIARNDVPSQVQSAFTKKFKDAMDVDWERDMEIKEKSDRYKASFEIGGVDHAASFSALGKLEKLTYDIIKNELPSAVSDKLSRDYANYGIDDISKEMKIAGKKRKEISYNIELDGHPDLTVRYDEKGHVLLKLIDR